MQEYKDYLFSIGLESGVYVDTVAGIIATISPFYSEKIEELFVSEYLRDDGSRVHDSLWFFSKSFVTEVKTFLDKDKLDWDIMSLSPCVPFVNFKSKDYNFSTASKESRLAVGIQLLPYSVLMNLKATGTNCDTLLKLINRFIRPRIN
jgi:hypothetical protein